MPIEFQCQSCSKTLRVPDTAVGKRVKCPGCQQISSVPTASTAPKPSAQAMPSSDNPFAADPKQDQAGFDANPYAAPSAAASLPSSGKPMGAGNGKLEASKAVSVAWKLFQENIGILVGAFVVLMVVNQVISFAQQLIQMALMGAAGGRPGPGGGINQEQLMLLGVSTLAFALISGVIQGFLMIGMIRIQLCIARGQQTSFGMLFSGGRWLLKVVIANLIFGLIVGLGIVALIVPGIYLALRYWSYQHFIIDKDCGILESFTLAGEASKGNLGESFVLFLIGFGLAILGMLMLCIGLIFTTPIAYLSMTIAYLMMSSQRYRQTT